MGYMGVRRPVYKGIINVPLGVAPYTVPAKYTYKNIADGTYRKFLPLSLYPTQFSCWTNNTTTEPYYRMNAAILSPATVSLLNSGDQTITSEDTNIRGTPNYYNGLLMCMKSLDGQARVQSWLKFLLPTDNYSGNIAYQILDLTNSTAGQSQPSSGGLSRYLYPSGVINSAGVFRQVLFTGMAPFSTKMSLNFVSGPAGSVVLDSGSSADMFGCVPGPDGNHFVQQWTPAGQTQQRPVVQNIDESFNLSQSWYPVFNADLEAYLTGGTLTWECQSTAAGFLIRVRQSVSNCTGFVAGYSQPICVILMSRDFSAYALLQYDLSNLPAAYRAYDRNQMLQRTTMHLDPTGIFYFAGTQALDTTSALDVYSSFGYNFPAINIDFNISQLPPFTLPCYNPCMNIL